MVAAEGDVIRRSRCGRRARLNLKCRVEKKDRETGQGVVAGGGSETIGTGARENPARINMKRERKSSVSAKLERKDG
jgi:hypothetical protein